MSDELLDCVTAPRTRPWSETPAVELPAEAGFTPWERWAWSRIARGFDVDMENFPTQGGDYWTETAVDRDKSSVRDVATAPEDWPAWQGLSERFLRTVMFHEPWCAALEEPKVSITSALISDKIYWLGRRCDLAVIFHMCRFTSSVEPIFCRFASIMQMSNSQVDGVFSLARSSVGDLLNLTATRFLDAVQVDGATIGSDVALDGTTFEKSFSVTGSHIANDIFFNDVDCRGEVMATEAKIGRGISITKSRFAEDVTMLGVRADGDIFITECRFAAKLDMQRLRAGGALFVRGNELITDLDLSAASIEGDFQLHAGAKRYDQHLVEGAFAGVVELFGARVGGELLLDSPNHAAPRWGDAARLSLRNAHVGALHCSLEGFRKRAENGDQPKERRRRGYVDIDLSGFTADQLTGHDDNDGRSLVSEAPEKLAQWLAHGGSHERFAPGPYRMIAEGLERAGERAKARHILRALGGQEARSERNVALAMVMRLSGVLIGYGYGTWRAAFWFALLIAGFAAAGLGWDPNADWASFADWRAWLSYAADNAIPVFELSPLSGDFVASRFPAGPPDYFGLVFGLERAAGFAIVSFVVAGLAGWARSRAGG